MIYLTGNLRIIAGDICYSSPNYSIYCSILDNDSEFYVNFTIHLDDNQPHLDDIYKLTITELTENEIDNKQNVYVVNKLHKDKIVLLSISDPYRQILLAYSEDAINRMFSLSTFYEITLQPTNEPVDTEFTGYKIDFLNNSQNDDK